MSKERRDLAEQIDQFCGRLNNGLMAVTIVLAALVLLAGVYRVAETLVIPQSFATVGTTRIWLEAAHPSRTGSLWRRSVN